MAPLWLLERFIDFAKVCEFCQEYDIATNEAAKHWKLRPRLSTSLRCLFRFQRMDEEKAAALIQRNYRGYRERRQLSGFGLSASTRWKEAYKELDYRYNTRPTSRGARPQNDRARQNWRRLGAITRRAAEDDIDSEDSEHEEMSPGELEKYRQNKQAAKLERDKTAKMMGLQYFLEMVDRKHRYGSNLRTYHEQWLQSQTDENFFYWLDHGEGRKLDLPLVPRSRLDSERVRYLSKEERQNYLVQIDGEGRLCWARNGERISTTRFFKDTIDGIVPLGDEHDAWKYGAGRRHSSSTVASSSTGSSVLSHGHDANENEESKHYANRDLKQAKGWKKLKHVSAATIFDQLMQKSVKPNSWIFVADTSFRLYVGIKQSGAFQHSSFLHGGRISAAGLIKIKDGQLRQLSPLSGHYRPPTKNFRLFVHSLKDEGVDMSRVSISRAYAILVGLETYVKTRKKFEHGVQHIVDGKDKTLHHEQYKKKHEQQLDNSESAQRERTVIALETEKQGNQRPHLGLLGRMMTRLHFPSEKLKGDEAKALDSNSTARSKPAYVSGAIPEYEDSPSRTTESRVTTVGTTQNVRPATEDS